MCAGKDRCNMSDWSYFQDQKIESPHLLPSLALAYIGDAVYELSVRRYIIARGITRTASMHSEAVRYVCADTQACMMRTLEQMLTAEEAAVARRGRNAKGHTPRNVSVASYRSSTGLECLVGYLFLKGDWQRLRHIMESVFTLMEQGSES